MILIILCSLLVSFVYSAGLLLAARYIFRKFRERNRGALQY